MVLRARGKFLEEMSAAGIMLSHGDAGDAVQVRVRVEAPVIGRMTPDLALQPVDILLYATPDPAAFDWNPFLPPAELRPGPGQGYGCNLTHVKLKGLPDLSLAIYHARRFVTNGVWSDLVIPLDDFLCLYGCGELAGHFQEQRKPASPQLLAAALLAPWPRKGRFETTIDLRDINLVNFKTPPSARISYYQLPEPGRIIKSPQGRFAAQPLPGEPDLPAGIRKLLDGLEE